MNRIFSSLRNRWLTYVIAPVLRYLTTHNLPRPTARLLSWHIKTVRRPGDPVPNENAIRILVLPKAGFNEDIESCFGGQPEFSVHGLSRTLVKGVFAAYLPTWVDDNNYLSLSDDLEAAKRDLRAFWVGTLRAMNIADRFDVVMSGNFSYAAEQELASALTELGIPFIALHKECLMTPGLAPFYTRVFRERKRPFEGRMICVYNETTANIQREAGIVTSDRVVVTGMPRLDRVHRLRECQSPDTGGNPHRPTVLFVSFGHKTGIPRIGRKIAGGRQQLSPELESLGWIELARECHQAMIELARRHPEIRVIVKTKHDEVAAQTLAQFVGDSPKPPNYEVAFGGDIVKLMQEASVVTGFISTALFEALALNKPLVIPRFAEALRTEYAPYLIDFGSTAEYVHSKEALVTCLAETAHKAHQDRAGQCDLTDDARAVLDRWVSNPDGRAHERIRAVVHDVVAQAPA